MKTSLMALIAAMTFAGAAQASEAPKSPMESQKIESSAVKKESKAKHRAAKAATKEEGKKTGG